MKSENKKPNFSREEIDSILNLISKNKFDQALKKIKILIQIYPKKPLLFNIAGVCYLGMFDNNLAINSFKKALSLKSDYLEAHNNLGIAYKNLGRIDSSISSFDKVISIMPNYVDAYCNLGILFKELGQIDKSIQSFKKLCLLIQIILQLLSI
jgi:tetratricopeptide (TPR) repeat protein